MSCGERVREYAREEASRGPSSPGVESSCLEEVIDAWRWMEEASTAACFAAHARASSKLNAASSPP